jgi:hypothetical protein
MVPQLVALLPVGSSAGSARSGQRRIDPGLVSSRRRGIRLEQGHSGPPNRKPPARTPGKALTNFSRTLPPGDSDLAPQVLKDPYNFDFLTLASSAKERELERGLLLHLRDLLMELGRGFAFVGSQVPLAVRKPSTWICSSTMSGCMLTSSSSSSSARSNQSMRATEYAFKDIEKPISISTYRVTRELPEPLQAEVLSIEDLEGIVEQLRMGSTIRVKRRMGARESDERAASGYCSSATALSSPCSCGFSVRH